LREGEVREQRTADEGEEPDRAAVDFEDGLVTATEVASGAIRPGTRPGRRRLSLAWLGTLPFFAYALLFLFLPAGEVLVGAFKGAHGGWTMHNLRLLFHEPYVGAYRKSIEVSLTTALIGGFLGLGIAYAAIREGTPRWIRSG